MPNEKKLQLENVHIYENGENMMQRYCRRSKEHINGWQACTSLHKLEAMRFPFLS